jgi:ATP-dependent DNA helicase PIF1
MLRQFPGEEKVFVSADSVKNNRENGNNDLLYPAEYLNSINCSGSPLSKLKLKVGCSVIILRHLNPGEGVCN